MPIHPLSYETGVPFFKGLLEIIDEPNEKSADYRQLRTLIESYQPDLELSPVAAVPFKAETYTREIDTLWLKRIFLEASQRLIRLIGETPSSREKLVGIARSLGLSEDAALDGLETLQDDNQDLKTWLNDLTIDYVAWDDHKNPNYFWAFPYDNFPIKPNALVHLYEGQALLIVHEGQVTDVLEAGSHRFNPKGLPHYTEVSGWTGDAVRPHFVFVKTAASRILRWGCPEGLLVETDAHGPFHFMPYGRCVLSIADPELIHRRFNCHGLVDDREATARLKRLIGAHFQTVLVEILNDIEGDLGCFIEDIDQMRRISAPRLKTRLAQIGLNLNRFEIESITLPTGVDLKPFSERGRALGEVGNQVLGNQTTGASINTKSSRSIIGSPKGKSSVVETMRTEPALGDTDTSYDFAPDHEEQS
ncbi:MAG: SPFH domain-containing protein [Myxococcota bacterium]|nr:SPFH domain-containing protein [Myxococcota bacterium]